MTVLDPPATPEDLIRIVLAMLRSKRAEASGRYNTPPVELNAALIRSARGFLAIERVLGFQLTYNSGYRAPALNALVGGAAKSQHVKCEAGDIVCPAFGSHVDVFLALVPNVELLGIDQLILEPGWVHASFAAAPRHELLRLTGGRYVPWDPSDPTPA